MLAEACDKVIRPLLRASSASHKFFHSFSIVVSSVSRVLPTRRLASLHLCLHVYRLTCAPHIFLARLRRVTRAARLNFGGWLSFLGGLFSHLRSSLP
jgi:hypothetical protein